MSAVLQTSEFAKWFHALTDARAFARIDARIARMAAGNLGDVKSVGVGYRRRASISARATGSTSRGAAPS